MSLGRALEAEVVNALGPVDGYAFSPFAFERITEGYEDAILAFAQNYWTWTVYASIAYVIAIFGIQKYMEDKPRMNLRPLLALWSGILGIFSIFGAVRSLPPLWHMLTKHSLLHSVCYPGFFEGVSGFWMIAFMVSKPYELGDTFFIVLRKGRLIFLHWYHHITVLMCVWYSYTGHDAPGRWGSAMNYTVHAFMYSYYALKAMQVRVPRWVSIGITSMQIVQMFTGTAVLLYAFAMKRAGVPCQMSDTSLNASLLMYLSYLVLFSHFFYLSYLRPARPAASKAAKAE